MCPIYSHPSSSLERASWLTRLRGPKAGNKATVSQLTEMIWLSRYMDASTYLDKYELDIEMDRFIFKKRITPIDTITQHVSERSTRVAITANESLVPVSQLTEGSRHFRVVSTIVCPPL